jgi:hypothetical protein
MKFPTQLGNLIFSAEQYGLALKFKFKTFLRNFKQLARAPAADEVLGLIIAYNLLALDATEITMITLISGHGFPLLDFCTNSFTLPAQWGAAPERIATIDAEKMLIAPAPGMVALAAMARRNARIDHGAALRTKAHRRFRAAMIKIITGIGCHFISFDLISDQTHGLPDRAKNCRLGRLIDALLAGAGFV